MANAVTLGRAYVVIGAKIDSAFNATLGAVSKSLAGIGKDLVKAGAGIGGLGAAITAPLIAMAQEATQGIDAIAKAARRAGTSTEFMSEMSYAAKLADVDMATLEKSIFIMSRTLMNAGAAAKGLQAINLSPEDIRGKAPEEQFEIIAEAISKVTDAGKRAQGLQLFGRGSNRLIPLISGGAAGLREGRQEARRQGVSISPQDAKQAEEYADMQTRVQEALRGMAITVGRLVIPSLQRVAVMFTNLINRARAYLDQNPQVIETAYALGRALLLVGGALVAVGTAFQGLAVVVSPGGFFVAILAGVLYLTGALDDTIKKVSDVVMAFEIGGRTVGSWLALVAKAWETALPSFGWIAQGVAEAFGSVWDYLKSGASYAINGISAILTAGFYAVMDKISGAFTRFMRGIFDLEYGLHIIDDKMLTDRVRALDALTKRNNETYGKAGAGAINSVKAPEFKTPSFEKIKAGLAQVAQDTKDILGKPIGDAIENLFGEGSSTVKSLSDIFKDLGQVFGENSKVAPATDEGGLGGVYTARKLSMESRGTFSTLAASALTSAAQENPIQQKQLLVLAKIADNTAPIKDMDGAAYSE